MINLPTPYAASQVTAFLAEHPCWSAFWDKHEGSGVSRRTTRTLSCTP